MRKKHFRASQCEKFSGEYSSRPPYRLVPVALKSVLGVYFMNQAPCDVLPKLMSTPCHIIAFRTMEFVVVIVSVESGVAKILKKIIAVFIECRQTKTESVTYQLDCSVISIL